MTTDEEIDSNFIIWRPSRHPQSKEGSKTKVKHPISTCALCVTMMILTSGITAPTKCW